MKRKYLIILWSLIFVLLIILGHYIFVSITYVPRAEMLMENSIEENFIKENKMKVSTYVKNKGALQLLSYLF